jgi:hypothetical protein
VAEELRDRDLRAGFDFGHELRQPVVERELSVLDELSDRDCGQRLAD